MPATMLTAALATMAIVTQDQAQLRAAPRDSAQQQAVLWQGDSLEIRGEKMDYLQVYDHRRERAGYIRASQVRKVSLKPADAGELLSVVRFLKDTPGAEALGIAYSAAYLRAAPAETIDAEPFDALGSMADRLGRRASGRIGRAADNLMSAHLEVVANYGVVLRGYENDGRIRMCYDGEAFRRVLALRASARQQATAALGLTRQECLDPAQRPHERYATEQWRADVLDKVDMRELPPHIGNRVRMRRAAVWATLAFERARRAQPARDAAARALLELGGVIKTELAEEDRAAHADAGVRVGSVRWAAAAKVPEGSGLRIVTSAGQPGETCVSLLAAGTSTTAPLATRCTYGIVWSASARGNAQGSALMLAVQPMAAWREMWVFLKRAGGWTVDVLPPAAVDPDLGYAEFAGWIPGAAKVLVVREARVDGRFKRSFEVVDLATLAVDRRADEPELLSMFQRWQDPAWKSHTLSLR